MRTKIHFTHMDRSESVENHAMNKLEKIVTDFGGRPDYHLQVWLVSENPKLAKGAPLYKCEVSVRFPPKKEVFVQKSSEDMYDAINFAASALQVALRESNKKDLKSKNRNTGTPTPL